MAKNGVRSLKTKKFIRNIVVSIVALATLFMVAGVAYTWYTGRQIVKDDSSNLNNLVENNKIPVIKHNLPAENADVGASVQSITSPLAPGENATIIVRTRAFATCKIVVEYNKVASRDSGLVARVADEYGMVSWTWTVEQSAPVGNWPATVTCAYNKKSGMVIGYLEVKTN